MFPQLEALLRGEEPDDLLMGRDELTTTYSWAIPSPAAIAWMVEVLAGRKVVEVGAGSGYWSWLLQQAGVDTVAYDLLPPDRSKNAYHKDKVYRPVLRGNSASVKLHPDRVLYMSWPPYGGRLGNDALRYYEGDTLLYCGEDWGGCCANDTFFRRLGRDWELVDSCADHVTWSGMHDTLSIYKRLQ